MAKEELNRQLVAGPFLRALGAIFVRRGEPMAGLEDTTATRIAVEAGELVVFFPEGTLMRMPGLLPFRMSAFLPGEPNAIGLGVFGSHQSPAPSFVSWNFKNRHWF